MSLDGQYDPDNIFAKIVRGDMPSAKVFEDHDTLALMDVFPQGRGHTLVIHKRAHARNLLDVEPDALQSVILTTQRIARAQRAAFKPDGIYVAQFNGAASGQTIFHLHFHVIPRWDGVPLGRHAGGGMADPAELAQLAEAIAAEIFVTQGLTLRFTRVSPTHHRFEYRRPDGSGEAIEMETRSLLFHDLLHHAVESEADLKGSFYGILGRIGGYEELTVNGGAALGGEVAITERVVGALTGALQQDDLDADAFVAQVTEFLEIYDERSPRWLTPAFILAVRERMRQLMGRWKATPFGETMELTFPPSPSRGG